MKFFCFWFLLALSVFLRLIFSRPVYREGDKIRLTAGVWQEPIIYSSRQRLAVSGLTIFLNKNPEIHYGDRIVVEGTVFKKELKNPKLISLSENKNFLTAFRQKIISFFQTNFPEPHASLISGMVLGSKQSIPYGFWQKLTKTGTAHVVVASGMNVTIVAGFLLTVATLFLTRKKAILVVLIGICGYVFLAGLEAPIIRAAIMGLVAFSAQEFGRLISAWRILVFTALAMLFVRPDWIFDLGFILSFVATTSLMLFEKPIRGKLTYLPEILREGFSTSLSAQIGVTPILFVTFGQFNILSPVINALILWTVPLITVGGAIAGAIGLVLPFLGKALLYLLYPLTWWFVTIVRIFS